MIEFIEGKLVFKSPSLAVVQVGGMGVRGIISLNTYDDLPALGQDVRLWAYLQIREEELLLFAFSTQEERWLFQNLISVNGVGPKLAITMLSGAKADTIRKAVAEGDSARLKSIPRIGAKIADRVVLELQKKIGQEMPDFARGPSGGKGHEVREAIEALSSLGFTRVQAENAIETALKREAESVEELVKQSLRME